MEFTSEILQAISKRAWKLSWILVAYSILCLGIILFIFIDNELYVLNNFSKIHSTQIGILKFSYNSLIVSSVIFSILFILKGDSDNTIKKAREKFYEKAFLRVKLVFQYRFNFPIDDYKEQYEIRQLTEYQKEYSKNEENHKISINNLNSFILNAIDTLYITYSLNNKKEEKILFSIWHSGTFVAIAIAIDKKYTNKTEKEINDLLSKLNLSGSIEDINRLTTRDNYWWFDIKYNTSDDFLFHNIEKEQISRKVAHIVTVGLNISMEILGWQKIK
ncbi:hypothetical protein ACN091_06665 [Aliarcobacter butzleri]|uniref:hypothetical protein n=1 Tax=Aliarcobacter butzleri TaxID=28197 RepID=UPI003AE67977